MANLVTQPTARPTRKVRNAGGAGLVTAVVIAVINNYAPGLGDQVGPEVAAFLVAGAAAVAGWFTKERAA